LSRPQTTKISINHDWVAISVSVTRYPVHPGYRAEYFATQDMTGRPALTWQDDAYTAQVAAPQAK
jgi:hypothetical protein